MRTPAGDEPTSPATSFCAFDVADNLTAAKFARTEVALLAVPNPGRTTVRPGPVLKEESPDLEVEADRDAPLNGGCVSTYFPVWVLVFPPPNPLVALAEVNA